MYDKTHFGLKGGSRLLIKDRQKETGDEIRIIGNLPKVFRVGDLNLETKSNKLSQSCIA